MKSRTTSLIGSLIAIGILTCSGSFPFANRNAAAQSTSTSFSSGSTGADGAFAPTASVALQVPPSGTFNFTTINIPAAVTVTFFRNATNTPVTMLASGDVTILGTISLDGTGGAGV